MQRLFTWRGLLSLGKVVMYNLAETECQVGDEVGSRDDPANRQAGNVAHGMLE